MKNNWDKLLQGVEDLNKEIGNIVYILIMDDMMIGSTRKSDINEHLAMYKGLVSETVSTKSIESLELIHGTVFNPLELPVELPKKFEDYDIWLIKTNKYVNLLSVIEYEIYDNMEEIMDDIELCLKKEPSLQIEDFAVIIGNSVNLIIQVDTETKPINNTREIM